MIAATWNVNSIAARLPLVLDWIEAARPDVLCLQEIKCTDDKFPRAEFEAAGYGSLVFGQPSYNGVAILSRAAWTDARRGLPGTDEAEARLLGATIDGVRVVNAYVPNGQDIGTDKYKYKLDWLGKLRKHLDEAYSTEDLVLLCGDFNVAPEERDVHDVAAWTGHILFSRLERVQIDRVRQWGFTDAFRLHHEDGGFFSWWDYRAGAFPRNEGLRIDHIWVSGPLARLCTSCLIDQAPRAWERPSDHTPVVAEFAI